MAIPTPEKDGRRYYGLNIARRPEDPSRCIVEVWGNDRWPSSHQCVRKRGHGPGGVYCKQHDPDEVARRGAEAQRRWQERVDRETRPSRQRDAYRKALEQIAAGHNDPRSLAAAALKTE